MTKYEMWQPINVLKSEMWQQQGTLREMHP